ncbi:MULTISPECIES: class I SAM-dependent methyltransferase [Olivibacter]|jgi:ubiquinone/menaquinone biosynthesis C-methylase UbiE|uniref:Class I SAM-dependent methyltransferase n=2 Tax=Olivibacter TaxID=376469 RepID=A0ABV6HKB4_9SPHI|nr:MULTISPECIES: class I SAM-dependent methyltransferase [Olivibacter]MDX3913971.1 class I SAM-dependent methyltransferase [Pseudosphingobacterium sp.]QEL02119.1 class I SAM-dependent methyltransferase [Olivibacter sp. LS-1]
MTQAHRNIDRFNFRADNYDKYRPGYPQGLLDFIYKHNSLNEQSVIAELGAGTGILTEELVKWPCSIIAIEPNDEMREKAIQTLQRVKNCVIKDATAEETGLADHSIDLIICAQSFHWFDAMKAKREFERILKNQGKAAIIWNIRSAETTFEKEYEEFILEFSIDYKEVKNRETRGNNLKNFFLPNSMEEHLFIYDTYLTFEQLLGRTLSYSYMPNEGHKRTPEMKTRLRVLFDKYATNQIISLSYKTKLFMGML